jgi:predicted DNA-binding transcriptional regulator YafY
MNNFKDDTPKLRVLKVLRTILERPFAYTAKQLAEKCNVDDGTIKRYFEDFKAVGFDLNFDDNYRYAISGEKQYEHLQELLFFSEKDQDFMLEALSKNASESKQKDRILKKMHSIYDFTRLGSHLISGQFMTKINLLEKAKQTKKVVELVDYRSTNSASVSNKRIEAFGIMPKEDVLHGFDIDAKAIRHYRISRIARVELSDADWHFEGHHRMMPTDPFRISNAQQVRVKIKLKVGGYNELIERFPATYGFLQPTADEKDMFELDCMVNANFYGLSNFILGYHHHIVDILEPDSLLEHIKNEVQKINF